MTACDNCGNRILSRKGNVRCIFGYGARVNFCKYQIPKAAKKEKAWTAAK